MKQFSAKTLMAFVILLSAPSLWAREAMPDSLTADDVVRLTLHNNPAVQRAMEDVQAAEARVGQIHSSELPTVDGLVSYTRLDPVAEMAIGGRKMILYPNDNFDVHIGAYHTLYDFGKAQEQTALTKSRVQSAALAAELVRSGLAYQALRAFYAVLFLQQAIEVQDQQIAALNGHRSVAQKRVQSGTGLSFDVLTTDVRVAGAQNDKVDLQNQLAKQEVNLRELLGLSSASPFRLKGELTDATIEANEDSLASVALAQRTELQLARAAENTAKMQQQWVSLNALPALTAIVQAGFKNGYVPNLDNWKPNWVAGAQLQVPIYDGKRKQFQKYEADAAWRGEQDRIQALERQIRAEVGRAVADVTAAQEKLKISDVRIRQARDAVSIARSRYETGTITNVDVLDAETSLADAELARTQALYYCRLSRIGLEQVVGASKWSRTDS